jgi:gliding motility-associated protein GldM
MAGYKETPRQKMIAMMYLVLTALLALNVSREILNSFLIVNDSMETTTELFSHSVEEIYTDFEEQYQINPGKVEIYRNQALEIKELSSNLINYIEGLKTTVIAKTEGIPEAVADTMSLHNVQKKDNFDTPTNFFMGGDMKKGEAPTLKANIDGFREKLYSFIKPEDQEGFDLGLVTDKNKDGSDVIYRDKDGKAEEWDRHLFFHTILAADIVILNKMIAEIYNAETNVVNYLYSSISAKDFKFDKISAKVIAKSNYVFQGDEYNADIIVAAYDSKQDPEVYIMQGVDSLPTNRRDQAIRVDTELGKGVLSLPANSEGTQKYAGFVKITNPLGADKYYHFNSDYIVAKPSATISPTKMNVFYRGVDNPVSIAASGKADAQLKPQISSGSLTRTEEGWVVTNLPATVYETTIKIYADDESGDKFMGEQLFRVKRLPDPIAKVVGVSDGKIAKNTMLANPFLICRLPEYIDFKYDFKVTSFTMIIPTGGGYVSTEKSESQMFTDKMKSLISSLKKDDIIIFRDIKVQGPEGPRKIESINIQMK